MSHRDRRHKEDLSEDRRGRSRSPARRNTREIEDGRSRIHRHSRSKSPSFRRPHSITRSRSRSPKRRREHRSRSRTRSRERHRRRRSRSVSSSSSERSERHSKRRKEKKRKRSRSRDKKDKKKDKKKKKEKGAVTAQWGKYGIINESNQYDKEAEFRTWLVEERKINPETLSKDSTKKEFAKFIEDFNTATLPHEKYYNMDAFEKRMAAVRNGELLTVPDDGYDPNADMAAHSSAHKKASTSKDTYLSKEDLQELRRVQAERTQVAKMKLMGMDIKQSFGVRMDGNTFDE